MTQQGSSQGLLGSRVLIHPAAPLVSVLQSGRGGDEAYTVISWAKKSVGWSEKAKGTEANPKHPSLRLNNQAI